MTSEEIMNIYNSYNEYVNSEVKKGFYKGPWLAAMMKFGAYEMLMLLNNEGYLNQNPPGKRHKKIVE